MGCVCVSSPLVITASSFVVPLCSWKFLFLIKAVCDLITYLSVWEARVQQWNGDLGGFHIPMAPRGAN